MTGKKDRNGPKTKISRGRKSFRDALCSLYGTGDYEKARDINRVMIKMRRASKRRTSIFSVTG
jgi:hypothetical protein